MTYSCPRCRRSDGLWEGVELAGWRALGADGKYTGRTGCNDRDIYWDQASPDGCVGCGECEWEGGREDLWRDGKPPVSGTSSRSRAAGQITRQQPNGGR